MQEHEKEFRRFEQAPPFTHGLDEHSLTSWGKGNIDENKQNIDAYRKRVFVPQRYFFKKKKKEKPDLQLYHSKYVRLLRNIDIIYVIDFLQIRI